MKQGIYLPPDANEALRNTQPWQMDVVKFVLALETLMAGEATLWVLHCLLFSTHAWSKDINGPQTPVWSED